MSSFKFIFSKQSTEDIMKPAVMAVICYVTSPLNSLLQKYPEGLQIESKASHQSPRPDTI